jgi:hypothetical protein
MWIISGDGFVSLVQHKDDPTLIRARARRLEHLVQTFDVAEDQVIDLGPKAPDYRWHLDIPRSAAAHALAAQVETLDYDSHVKESVSGKDNVMYRAMLSCWTALHRLQDPEPSPSRDWWTPPAPATYAPGFDEFDNGDPDEMDREDMSVEFALDIADEYTHEDAEGDEVVEALLVLARALRGEPLATDEPEISDRVSSIAEQMLATKPKTKGGKLPFDS